jgi:nitroreductase
MDILVAIKGRKSIRGFKADPVPKEKIKDILAAAVRAPSAINTQPGNLLFLPAAF